jgi:hypothetical protein
MLLPQELISPVIPAQMLMNNPNEATMQRAMQ